MAITSLEVDLVKLDQALGGKGLVADFNDPKKKVILAAEGSDVTDEDILDMIESQHPTVLAEKKAKETEEATKATAKAALLDRLGITADEAVLLLG